VLRTPFVEEWNQRREDLKREAERVRSELMTAVQQGRGQELVPFTGQSTGLIRALLPAGDIVRGIVAEAEDALKRTMHFYL